jgi:endoribonuclease Dicer
MELIPKQQGAMVSNSALAAICVWSGLQEHLLFDSLALASNMQSYADELKARQAKEYKLAEEEGRSPGQYWVDMDPPKVKSSRTKFDICLLTCRP